MSKETRTRKKVGDFEQELESQSTLESTVQQMMKTLPKF